LNCWPLSVTKEYGIPYWHTTDFYKKFQIFQAVIVANALT